MTSSIVDAVRAEHHREDDRHHLATSVRAPRPTPAQTHQIAGQRLDPQALSERGDEHHPRVADGPLIIELDLQGVQSDRLVIVHHEGDLLLQAPAAANSRKSPALDTAVLRAGRTGRLLGGWIPAPSTLGTFLRAFTFGHVRQLDALLGRALVRAWQAGAGPGDGRLIVDVDSFVGQVHGYQKQGAAYGYTKLFGYHPILATRADTREALHIRLRKGSANTQRGIERFCEELIARIDRAGATGEKLLRADSGFWNTKVF